MKCSPAIAFALVAFAAESVLAIVPSKHGHPGSKWDEHHPTAAPGHHPSRVGKTTTVVSVTTASKTVTAVSTVTATATVTATSTVTAISRVTDTVKSTQTATITVTTPARHPHRTKKVSASPIAYSHKRDANDDKVEPAGGHHDAPTSTDASSTSVFPTDTSNVSVTPVSVAAAATQSPLSFQVQNLAASNEGSLMVVGMGLSALAAFFI